MNSPLSYIDPSNVGAASIMAGITPVSMGGDSIGGTISVKSPAPLFGDTADAILQAAKISSFYRSNGDGLSGRSEEHTSELQSLMRISYAVFCLQKKNNK